MTSRVNLLYLSLVACASGAGPADELNQRVDAVCALTNAGLIETDPAILNDTSFPLQRVFDAIRLSTPAGTSFPSSATPMFQELYAPFNICTSSATIDPNGYGLKCRPPEASLALLDPFATSPSIHYKPVAIANRLDLAPADFSYCGESRIVYWKDSGPTGRAAIIVELKTPTAIVNGVSTCRPVIDFWANLSSVTDAHTRTKLLTDFFFKGIAASATASIKLTEPPASANGAGFGGPGQVRLNSFVSFAQWNLRELKWQRVCTTTSSCSAHFVEVTVKNNPSQLLFAGTHPNAPAFQSWFVGTETAALATAPGLNQIALPDADNFNTFESISQPLPGDPTSVNYGAAASPALRANIASQLAAIGSPLTVDNVLARATTQTCGGCHQVSNGASLGGGLVWPFSNGFTMIDENATLSPALVNVFLPFRLQVLESLACPSTSQPLAGAVTHTRAPDGSSGTTVSGLPVGAPN